MICNGLLCLAMVIQFQLCSLTAQVAYDESGRSEEIDEVLNILLIAVHRVQLTANFPKDLPMAQLESVHCAALDLCSSVMEYLAIALKNLERSFICTLSTSVSETSERVF